MYSMSASRRRSSRTSCAQTSLLSARRPSLSLSLSSLSLLTPIEKRSLQLSSPSRSSQTTALRNLLQARTRGVHDDDGGGYDDEARGRERGTKGRERETRERG